MVLQSQCGDDLFDVERRIGQVCAYLDVLLDVQVGYQVVHLEDIPEMLPSIDRKLLLVHVFQLVAVDTDITRVGRVDSAYYVEQGRLTRT